ncbi:MAG: PBSX family phage terminase large subunit, partial [Flavobacteriaceae bacterium]|nr:PBSX family phage terminase large subunit [Flavobacteriaceae bacterium]
MEEAKFIVTTNLVRIAELEKRIRIVQGGSSAGKTFSIVPILISYAADNSEKYISIVSESTPHLKRGAMKDFEVIMRATGRWQEGSFNKQNLVYTFQNGSKIEFFSADSPDKLRGARRDALFINEA